MSKHSSSTAQKVKKMILFDMIIKTVVLMVLVDDIILYMGTVNVIAVCVTSIILLGMLILFEYRMLNCFTEIADYGQSTKQKLVAVLTYLQSGFTGTLLAISFGYPFIFISGTLVYFFAEYGRVRLLDGIDTIVFSGFIIVGIIFNLVYALGCRNEC